AVAVGIAQPGHTDTLADAKFGALPYGFDMADDLMAGHDRNRWIRKLAIDHMQVGSTHATGMYADQQLAGPRHRNGACLRVKLMTGRMGQHHRSHMASSIFETSDCRLQIAERLVP